MKTEFLNFGRDMDEFAMSTDKRPLKKRVLDWINKSKEKKWYPVSPTTPEERRSPEEPIL